MEGNIINTAAEFESSNKNISSKFSFILKQNVKIADKVCNWMPGRYTLGICPSGTAGGSG